MSFPEMAGRVLHTTLVPGTSPVAIAWCMDDARLAVAVDEVVYFIAVRMRHSHAHFGTTLAYAFRDIGQADHSVLFWDVASNGHRALDVPGLASLAVRPSWHISPPLPYLTLPTPTLLE